MNIKERCENWAIMLNIQQKLAQDYVGDVWPTFPKPLAVRCLPVDDDWIGETVSQEWLRMSLTEKFAPSCRCGSEFCQRHRNPEDHDCDFDYRDLGKQELMKNNPIIRPKKITKL